MIDYRQLALSSLSEGTISQNLIEEIIGTPSIELLKLCVSAFKVRSTYWGNKVKIHILNSVKSGNCHEDCHYCAQSNANDSDGQAIHDYKSREGILAAAGQAYELGAYRYCMAFSGRCQPKKRLAEIAELVLEIKRRYPLQVCVSAGFLDDEDARLLSAAGVNRYNHNINTSRVYYEEICTSHSFDDRLSTINIAKRHGLELCCGAIIGMGESTNDLLDIFLQLKEIQPASIPVNFFIPVAGHRVKSIPSLNPALCIRILCAFRFAFPQADIRVAAGREYHLRSLQSLCLYSVSSIFANGYLTVEGAALDATKQMIKDNGFVVDAAQ